MSKLFLQISADMESCKGSDLINLFTKDGYINWKLRSV